MQRDEQLTLIRGSAGPIAGCCGDMGMRSRLVVRPAGAEKHWLQAKPRAKRPDCATSRSREGLQGRAASSVPVLSHDADIAQHQHWCLVIIEAQELHPRFRSTLEVLTSANPPALQIQQLVHVPLLIAAVRFLPLDDIAPLSFAGSFLSDFLLDRQPA